MKGDDMRPGAKQWRDATRIRRVEAQHQIGARYGRRRGYPSRRPRPVLLFGRMGHLGHHVGNTQAVRYLGTQPIGRLMVKVIGKPHLRPLANGPRSVAMDQTRRQSISERTQATVPPRRARTVVASESRCQFDRMSTGIKGRHQQARHAPVARRRRVVRRLHGGIKGNAHH